jgi:3-deoxy-D-manno-octulosonic-acid transferase
LALRLYQGLGYLVMPWLRLSARLRSGYDQRTLRTPPPRADLWIQAASVGEAYLARELVKRLEPVSPTTVLLTTNTSQGLAILKEIKEEFSAGPLQLRLAYCPFDQPSLMARALTLIQPRLVVLLESELWPGLMAGCKKEGVKLLVINGRMTENSLRHYQRWPAIWRDLRPSAIMAMSEADSRRFAALFGADIVETMANIKFDRIHSQATKEGQADNPLLHIIPPDEQFVVLGSIRQEEEEAVAKLLAHLCRKNPRLLIALFPRHLHRLDHWQKHLTGRNLTWQLRSQCRVKVKPGTVILWDTMGELERAYALARAAFVGGSLAPVGGHNFLEPLGCGIRPVIGPHWENFSWIGRGLIAQGLVHEAQNWQGVARYLLEEVQERPDRRQTREALHEFLRHRQGGAQRACQKIKGMLAQP